MKIETKEFIFELIQLNAPRGTTIIRSFISRGLKNYVDAEIGGIYSRLAEDKYCVFIGRYTDECCKKF